MIQNIYISIKIFLKMKKLKNLGVKELQISETLEIDGGRLPWKKIWDGLQKAAAALEIGDAIDEFVDGWNSVDCGCEQT